MPSHRVLRWSLGLACATGAVIALAGVETPLRPALTGLFLMVAPAAAVVGPLRDRDVLTSISAGVAASLVMNLLLATSMLFFDSWSPRAGVATIAVLSGSLYALRLLYRQTAHVQTEQGDRSQ